MAFHPNFPADSRVFVQYTTQDARSVLYTHVSSFTSTDGGRTLDPTSEQVVLRLQQKSYRHKAGTIAFGPDGYLYIGLGDDNRADQVQNTLSWYGKMLRIDVDNGTPYAIPSDNPFASGKGGAPEVYAWGFRNPWQWHFDKVTGDLWLGDVGRASWEEVDRVVRGGNYGWPIREGAHCLDNTQIVVPLASLIRW